MGVCTVILSSVGLPWASSQSVPGQHLGIIDTGFFTLPVSPSICGYEKSRVPLGLYFHLQFFLLLDSLEVGDGELPTVMWSCESVSALELLCR